MIKNRLFLCQQQLKKAISVCPTLNAAYGVQDNSIRGYFNIRLHRARRTPGHEFGSEQMLRNISVFMARHPTPVPPIEVSVYFRLFRSFPFC